MPATLLWFSGLETGSNNEFDNGPDGEVATAVVRSGAYALKFDNALHGQASVQIPGLSATMYARFYFRPAGPPLESSARIYAAGTSTGRFRLLYRTDGTLQWDYDGDGPFDIGANTLVVDSWNLIEIKQVRHASVGGMEVYLNSVLQFSTFTKDTTFGSSATQMRFFFGPSVNSMGSTPTYENGADTFLDDVAVGTGQHIGAGQCTLVGGKAGAPTYDAWTKVGDTTAALCWSAVPFSASKNCTHATSGGKQTMLTATLGAIAGSSVINGARMMAVAKVSSGFSTVKLLRRVAGADTVSATRSLGTTDAFIPNGVNSETFDVFVDTLANLNASEIGVEDSDSAVTTTVEDVWLMVDFAPGPPVVLTPLLPTHLEALQSVFSALPIPFEILGQALLNPAIPIPLDIVGWLGGQLPIPIEIWRGVYGTGGGLPVPVEVDGVPDGSLGVAFAVITAAYGPFRVSFDVYLIEENMGPLSVVFDVKEGIGADDAGLEIHFSALPEVLFRLRMDSDPQAPIVTWRLE